MSNRRRPPKDGLQLHAGASCRSYGKQQSAKLKSCAACQAPDLVAELIFGHPPLHDQDDSVGFARQYCGKLGKQDNCQVAVNLSVASDQASLPIAVRLYLLEAWANDNTRRKEAAYRLRSRSRPSRRSPSAKYARRSLTAYRRHRACRCRLRQRHGFPRRADRDGLVLHCRRAKHDRRVGAGNRAAAGPALERPREEDQTFCVATTAPNQQKSAISPWLSRAGPGRPYAGAKGPGALSPHALPPCGCDHRIATIWRAEPRREEWLQIEWPEGEDAPTKYWLSTLPHTTSIATLVDAAKLRWRIERDFQDLQQEIGLDHYEGRGWRGFHHHAALSIAAYGFLPSERSPIPPSASIQHALAPGVPPPLERFKPRGHPAAAKATHCTFDHHTAPSACQAPAAMSMLHAEKSRYPRFSLMTQ